MSNYITPEGEARYREELARLWGVERIQLTQAVAVAAAEGDRSENAEYIYGKKRLRAMHARIRFLMKRLEACEVVFPDPSRDDSRIYFGAWVSVEDEEGEERRLRIVGPDETDLHEDNISMDSPVGRALLGKSLDDEVLIRRPKGNTTVFVTNIAYDLAPELAPTETGDDDE